MYSFQIVYGYFIWQCNSFHQSTSFTWINHSIKNVKVNKFTGRPVNLDRCLVLLASKINYFFCDDQINCMQKKIWPWHYWHVSSSVSWSHLFHPRLLLTILPLIKQNTVKTSVWVCKQNDTPCIIHPLVFVFKSQACPPTRGYNLYKSTIKWS